MIDVVPLGDPDSREHEAALQLRALMTKVWPQVHSDRRHNVSIFSNVRCLGQRVAEIDIVVFMYLWEPLFIGVTNDKGENVYVNNLCLTVEVKDHSEDSIWFVGNTVRVNYKDKSGHNATEQADAQQLSLRNYLRKHGAKPPYVVDLIWLRNFPERKLPNIENVLGREGDWNTFLRKIYDKGPEPRWTQGPQEKLVVGGAFGGGAAKVYDVLAKARPPSTPLDRSRIESISKRQVRDQKYGEKLGKQLLIFRGRGGAGKTVTLLRLANQLYEEDGKSTLLLTYNKALVADIRRLLGIMGINQGPADRSIVIETVHSFMGRVLGKCEICEEDPNFYNNYERYLEELSEYLREGVVDEADIEEMKRDDPDSFDWDHVMVDEAQDWLGAERHILFSLYGHRRLVVADGFDQLIRSGSRTDWKYGVPQKENQTVPLRKSLRLKGNLCRFANAFAESMGLDWEVEPNSDVYGGRVMILVGRYNNSPEIHKQIFEQHASQGNQPIDMLLCVPPRLAQSKNADELSPVAKKLEEWGWQVWDGVDKQERGKEPETVEQFRIVQYDSCRGLEGWTVVNLGFDEFYEWKVKDSIKSIEESNLLVSPQQAAHQRAAQWLMIPLTRAIDTLVIQVSSSDHVVIQALRAAKNKCNDVAEWLEWNDATGVYEDPEGERTTSP